MSEINSMYIGVSAAARQLGVTLDQVYKLIYAGKLAAIKEANKWQISARAVIAYKRNRRSGHGHC